MSFESKVAYHIKLILTIKDHTARMYGKTTAQIHSIPSQLLPKISQINLTENLFWKWGELLPNKKKKKLVYKTTFIVLKSLNVSYTNAQFYKNNNKIIQVIHNQSSLYTSDFNKLIRSK